jgi:hypothetical protein
MFGAPSLAGFNWFIRNIMGIPPMYLPDDAGIIPWAYEISVATVNQRFACVPSNSTPNSQIIYSQMVYNLGGHFVILWAPDVPGVYYKIDQNDVGIGYFAFLRQNFGMNTFAPGVVEESDDETTRTKLHVPKSLENLTIQDLEYTKTPYGRTYLGEAQKWNRPWGLS